MEVRSRDPEVLDLIAFVLAAFIFVVVLWITKVLFRGAWALVIGVALGSWLGLTIWTARMERITIKHAARSALWTSIILAIIAAMSGRFLCVDSTGPSSESGFVGLFEIEL